MPKPAPNLAPFSRWDFTRVNAAVTLSTYMGYDTLHTFMATPQQGAIVPCRTSNACGTDFAQLVAAVAQATRDAIRSASAQ